jgi:hypothetical protein
MKETNLNIFYQMGSELTQMAEHYGTGKGLVDLWIYLSGPQDWLSTFLYETKEMSRYLKDSRACAQTLLNYFDLIIERARQEPEGTVTYSECMALASGKEEFEKCFERETKMLSVFTVTPKGTYDTRILIEDPQEEFPERMVAVLPDKFVNDLKQAARCLVFDIPVGCAFHICRATESLMIAYYGKLAGQPWPFPNRDWSSYIDQLVKHKAPATITSRLKEIKDMDRNAYIHPDKEVSLEEAQVLYRLCSGVNYYMAEEMVKLTP